MQNGKDGPPTADATEDEIIAWCHADAGHAHGALSTRSGNVATLVLTFGRASCLAERHELQRLTRITCELSAWQFADLR